MTGTLSDWLDRQAGRIFVLPAVLVVLAFSVFPLIVSAYLSLSRFQLAAGGYKLDFIGILNYKKVFYGSQQFHLIGVAGAIGPGGWLVIAAVFALLVAMFHRAFRAKTWAPLTAALIIVAVSAAVATLLLPIGPFLRVGGAALSAMNAPWWGLLLGVLAAYVLVGLILVRGFGLKVGLAGLIGRQLAATVLLLLMILFVATTSGRGEIGSLSTTLFYVFGGVALQFAIGLGLALICAADIRGRAFFRLVFFLPLMVTPVGIAYTFRMLADMTVGPFAPIASLLGAGTVNWAGNAWTARLVVMLGDSWQWVPFMFIVLLAAIESTPREQVEAAQLDGASSFQVFRDVTWPSIAPVAATVVLIRLIEAFKIVDLPNVLTNGGPGIATESLTLHAFIEWRTLNLGGSAAVAYVLLFVSTVTAVSFFHFVVRPARGQT